MELSPNACIISLQRPKARLAIRLHLSQQRYEKNTLRQLRAGFVVKEIVPTMRKLLLLLFFFVSVPTRIMHAQDVSSMTGVVVDATGAVVPGTTVMLKNPLTGISLTQTTNDKGSYRFPNVPPNPGYLVTFSHVGFISLTIKDIALEVNNTRTQDAKLLVGSAQEIEVSAGNAEVTINTTDATVGNNINPELLNDLPVQSRTSPAALFTLQPGVQSNGSTTGSRTDQDQVTVDGLDVNDISTGQNFLIVAGAPVDAVQEFRTTVAGFNTDSGPGGGGQFALVTKNGTNKFHGDLNEYHRDTATAANTWFNNYNKLPRTPLIRNQFGGAIGGPIKKDKLFFFLDFNDLRTIQSTSVNRTVPLDSYRNGTINYILAKDQVTGARCTATSRLNSTPNCIGSKTPAQVAALDPAGIGESPAVFALINSVYPHANNVANLGDGVNTGGFTFTSPTPTFQTNYVGRLDYNLTDKQKLYAVARVAHEDAVQQAPEFPGYPNAPFQDRSYSWSVGHTWQVSSNKVNQITFGDTVENFNFPIPTNPLVPNLVSLGGLSDPYLSPVNAQGRRLPIVQLNDNFQWQKGSHSLSFGGFFKFISTSDNTKLDYNQAAIGLGGQTTSLTTALRPTDIRTSGTAGLTDWDTIFTQSLGRIATIGQQYNYSAAGTAFPLAHGDNRNYRYFQTELFVGDTWKVTPSLTLSYGVNYQIFSVPYEINGLESVGQLVSSTGNVTPFDFDTYMKQRVTQAASHVTGQAAVPYIQYVLGGKANNGPNLFEPEYHDFAPRFAYAWNPSFDRKTVFNGSIGLVYDRTVTNAVQYQQDQHSYLFQLSNTVSNGVQKQPAQSLLLDPRLGANASYSAPAAPAAPKTPYIPYVTGNSPTGTPTGLANGQDFNTMINSKFKTPYNIMVSFGMQHEFPAGFILKVNYAGRFGRRLLGQADANQIVDYSDPASGQTLSQAFAAITTQTRGGANAANLPAQPFFENMLTAGEGVANGYPNNTSYVADGEGTLTPNGDFGDVVQALTGDLPTNVGMPPQFSENSVYTNKGFSSYNGLLVNVHKNLNHGFQFDVNYTWAHSIDNVSLVANSGASGGYGFVCNVFVPRQCRGNSDFDINQLITSDYTYQLPFGQGKAFASNIPFWLNEVIGGWETSGLITRQTGTAFGLVANAFVPSYSNDAAPFFTGNPGDLKARVHKNSNGAVYLFNSETVVSQGTNQPGAVLNGPVGFDVGPRNNLRGPGFFNWDAGLAKNFAIIPSRNINLKFRADFFNVLNHASFSTPSQPNANTDITSSSFGVLTSTASTARVGQFALRLEF